MRAQTEKPGITPAALQAAVGASQAPRVSGGQIENFRAGWALNIMGSNQIAHYFRRDGFSGAVSLCRVQVSVRWLYGKGNFKCCQRCAALRRQQDNREKVAA
jgi:hypothetical protein